MYHSRLPHKKAPAATILKTNTIVSKSFADREYLTGALDSLVDLCTYGFSEPPSSKNAPSSEYYSSDLPLS
ncbi:hypothetical protein Tco_0360133 [Tanacetum coccineum]